MTLKIGPFTRETERERERERKKERERERETKYYIGACYLSGRILQSYIKRNLRALYVRERERQRERETEGGRQRER